MVAPSVSNLVTRINGAYINISLPSNGFTVHVNLLNDKATTPGAVIPTSFFSTLNKEVIAQCDKLDGVADGIITNVGAVNCT